MEKKNNEYKKGLWTAEEDKALMDYVKIHGKGRWNSISKRTGLKRCGKSCRLRWMNYLNPGIKRARFSEEEEDLIIRLHRLLGNRWCLIAGRIPGRTDNQIKNYWNSHLSKKLGAKKQVRKIAESEANNNSCSCDLGQAPLHSGDEASDRDPARTTVMSPQGYVSNPSLLWVSEFDGLMSESGADPGCFMDSICGNSFNFDWNHL